MAIENKMLSAVVPASVHDEVVRAARAEDRSVSSFIRRLILSELGKKTFVDGRGRPSGCHGRQS
jgi:hypothetical protein